MIVLEMPEGHPAKFIGDELKEYLTELEKKHGPTLMGNIVVARALTKMLHVVEHMASHGDESEQACAKQMFDGCTKFYDSAMHTLFGPLTEEEGAMAMEVIERMENAERAIHAVNQIAKFMPRNSVDALVTAAQSAAAQLKQSLDEVRKNAH